MKVLIAEDEAVSRRLMQASLTRWGYDVITTSDGCAALSILQEPEPPKLVVFDWMMPGLDGVELCRAIRAKSHQPYTYILMVTAKRTQENVVAGLSAGADDYITKPFDPEELRVRLRTGKRIVCLQDQLIAAREALVEAATHDSLTGLWNRPAILDALTNELNRADREHGSVGVVTVDLDDFKRVNDSHGHPVGDEVLRAIGRAMRSNVRPYDSVGRIGGEEFLVVLPGCNAINATSHAERLRAAIAELVMPTAAGPLSISASLGVSVGRRSLQAGELMRAADEALYAAKRGGRNRVEFVAAKENVQEAVALS
ncbi:MAG TPA: diguanylate cyclase [Pirellulales bacterium]